MKTNISTQVLLTTIVLILSLGLIGCKDNSSGSGSDADNSFEYDGETYTLRAGAIFDYGEFDGFINYDFILTEEDEDFESEDEEINSEYYIYFWLESLGEGSFNGGTFNYDDSGEAEESHLYAGELAFVTSGNVEEAEEFGITGGSVEVDIDGSTYTLVFDVTLDNGEDLTGSYTSDDFEIIDESSFEKANSANNNRFVK